MKNANVAVSPKKYDLKEALEFQIEQRDKLIADAQAELAKDFAYALKYYGRDLIKYQMARARYNDIYTRKTEKEMKGAIEYYLSEANRQTETMALNNSTCIFANATNQAEFEFFRSFKVELARLLENFYRL